MELKKRPYKQKKNLSGQFFYAFDLDCHIQDMKNFHEPPALSFYCPSNLDLTKFRARIIHPNWQ